jgi:hypothetical protein
MNIEDLEIGDIIFIRKGQYDYIHIGICTQAEGAFETTQMAHVLGKMEPYALVETHFAPKDILDKNDIHYDVVRAKKHTKIDDAVNIIKIWLRNLIPYDPIKYNRMVLMSSHKDIIGSEGSLNQYTESERRKLIETSIESQRQLYEEGRYNLISLAATRNFGPTPPFVQTGPSEVDGIICTSPVIMMFQIAAIAENVSSDLQFWVSDRNVTREELLSHLDLDLRIHREYYECMIRDRSQLLVGGVKEYQYSALRLIRTSLENIDFDTVPLGSRVDPLYCPVSTLFYSMLDDYHDFVSLGELTMLNSSLAADLRAKFENNIPDLVRKGREYREELCKTIIW